MAKALAVNGETRADVPQWKQGPDRFINFLKEVRSEMRKVVTPSRQEVQTTTTVVIITVFLFAAYFYLVDTIFSHAMKALLASLTR
jgi:preprotein translocase subunit SecE